MKEQIENLIDAWVLDHVPNGLEYLAYTGELSEKIATLPTAQSPVVPSVAVERFIWAKDGSMVRDDDEGNWVRYIDHMIVVKHLLTLGHRDESVVKNIGYIGKEGARKFTLDSINATPPPINSVSDAAQAVIDRWNSPKWEWAKQGPTADLIMDLKKALAALSGEVGHE